MPSCLNYPLVHVRDANFLCQPSSPCTAVPQGSFVLFPFSNSCLPQRPAVVVACHRCPLSPPPAGVTLPPPTMMGSCWPCFQRVHTSALPSRRPHSGSRIDTNIEPHRHHATPQAAPTPSSDLHTAASLSPSAPLCKSACRVQPVCSGIGAALALLIWNPPIKSVMDVAAAPASQPD